MAKKVRKTDGLRFKKLDLHVHTPASKCFADRTITAANIVEAALAAGMAGIGITDHNSGEWIDNVKAAAKGSDLTVFPGVEITCMGGKSGIHIIAIFDPSLGRTDIESLLGNLELKPGEYGDISTIVKKDPITVAKIIVERGGLAVLAHANSSKGALSDMQGQQRTKLVQSRFISAAEATDFQNAALQTKRKRAVDLLDGTDPDYQRKLAVYQASDNPSGLGDGIHAVTGIGTRTSYFKLDEINVDGLRQCFADPDVRIRQDYHFSITNYPAIKSVTVTGGFLDGAHAEMHDGLNTILGAKGAGKSLLIEFLRFALNQSSENPEIVADHESKLRLKLDVYSTVSVTLQDETGREFVVAREYNPAAGNPYTGTDHGDLKKLFPVLFLSQNEIIKIAENEIEQIAFIDRFLDFRKFQQKIRDFESEISQLDSQLADGFKATKDSRDIVKNVEGIRKELADLEVQLKNPVFDRYAQLGLKDRALREQREFLFQLRAQLVSQKEALAFTPHLPNVDLTVENDPAVKRIQALATGARTASLGFLDDAIANVDSVVLAADAEYSKWSPTYKTGKDEYDDVVQKSGGDYKKLAQKRAQLLKDLETEEGRLAVFKGKSDRVAEVVKNRDEQLDHLQKAYTDFTTERKSRCQQIEDQSGERLKVSIKAASNVDEFRKRLNKLKKGSWLKDIEIESITKNCQPTEFVRAVVRFNIFESETKIEELAGKVGIDKARMLALAAWLGENSTLEELLSLEHQAVPQDRPEIRYFVGGKSFAPLTDLSVGQKCTAMLVIALSDGVTPIVIDQPEDSLDIRSIWDDMCTKIRFGKERRQFIFTTHNSSLAVASDTDKFLILEADATRGTITNTGSMDHAPVKNDVIEYLEGGPETYRQKSGKYRIDE